MIIIIIIVLTYIMWYVLGKVFKRRRVIPLHTCIGST